jgi:cytochrome P450
MTTDSTATASDSTAGTASTSIDTSPRALGGPKPHGLAGSMTEYGRDPLGFMLGLREFGDFVPVRFGPFQAYFALGPAEVEEVLVTRNKDFRKSLGTRILIPLLGNGLLTAEADSWLRQRRLASPAFHRERVNGYARPMVDYTQEHVDRWQVGREIDLHDELMSLTLRIVARTLFDAEVTPRIREVADASARLQDFIFSRFSSLSFLVPTWLPTPANRGYRRTIERLDAVVYSIVRERMRNGEDRGDLLSMLIEARDEDGARMTQRQVRDEVMTLMLAGHETTALALTWSSMLLAQHPEAEARLAEELDSALGGRLSSPADVPALRFTEAVIYETLRLYPPAYATGREPIRRTDVRGHPLRPPLDVVFVSPYVSGRDPRYFEAPDSFRPERWLDGLAKRLPRGVFFPFGMGPRMCIGSSFAMLEATLLLATIAQRRRFRLVDGQDLRPRPAITLRPRAGLRMVVASAAGDVA